MEFFERLNEFATNNWRDAVEILILAVIIYYLYRYFKGTRAARILTGLALVLIVLTLVSGFLDLQVITWLLKGVSLFLALGLVVIFQPELRRGLAELGSHWPFSFSTAQRREMADDLVEISSQLAKRRFGALIAIERGISLKQFLETGVALDCRLSPEIIMAIFHPKAALHDGGVILRLTDERIEGAGCVFPVSQRELADRSVGLRHRAAMGITEESDAIAIVVSEETGSLSLAHDGVLDQDLSHEAFQERLYQLMLPDETEAEDDPDEPDDGDPLRLEG
ncbi:MAG: diadenylate cyclase CdaA [Verrucomicrobiota bacterium]